MTPLEFHSALMAYCHVMDASVTSYGRTWRHNQEVGGVENSNHLIWLAADVVYDFAGDNPVKDKLATQLGLEVVVEHDHDHLEPRKEV